MAVKKVKVKMRVSTAYQGPRKEGELVDVPEDFAKRWVKNGIAEYATVEDAGIEEEIQEEEVVEEETTDEEVVQEDAVEEEAVKDYIEMTAKELYEICQEKGIEVEPKKKKEYYLEKLA